MALQSIPVWMWLLLVLWAVLLIAAYLKPRADAMQHRDRRLLLASSAVLTIAAWSTVWLVREIGILPFPFLIAVGMTFGFVGDLFMAGVLRASNRLIAGLGFFGLDHVFYIAAGLLMFRLGFNLKTTFTVAWLAWLLAGLLAWYAFLYRGQRVTVLHWVALPYALLLASTAGVATGLALQSPRFLPFALGAALFFISDFLIALREFAGRRSRLIVDGVWLTYGPAQALIVYTAWFVLV
jgi:hypothetical protein